MTDKPNRSNKFQLYCKTCNHHHGATAFLCFHPDYIGCDGDGVSLTVQEQEFVKRMGCANHSQAQEYLMKDVIKVLESHVTDIVNRRSIGDGSTYRYVIKLIRGDGK